MKLWRGKSQKPVFKPMTVPGQAGREVRLPLRIGTGRTIFSDDPNDPRMKMHFLYSDQEKKLQGRVWFGEATSGPPGHVHGGILCYCMDEAMGTTAWAEQYPVVAGHLDFEFVAMVPVEREYQIVVEIEKIEDKKILLCGQILSAGPTVHLQAKGLFVRLARAKVEALSTHVPEGLQIHLDQMKWRRE